MPQSRIGEFDLIRRLERLTHRHAASILIGIGDDAAILKVRPNRALVATTDLLAERVHFDLRQMTYQQLGYKAMVANLSDIAAMGGTPRFALVALALPPGQHVRDIEALYAGMDTACRPAGTSIVGGDTSLSLSGLLLAITVLGETDAHRVLRRSGARPGDHLYVTGTLGDAKAGCELLQRRSRSAGPSLSARDRDYLTHRHMAPAARLAEGHVLATRSLARAAIDLSDGLAGDLRHICEESAVGALIDVRRLPLSTSLIAYARARRRDPADYALAGGEDYELLFTVPPTCVPRVVALIRRRRLQATAIGIMTPSRERIHIVGRDGSIRLMMAKSYEHPLRLKGPSAR